MLVKSRMTPNPYTISSEKSITDVMELMHEKNLKRVPVVDGDRVVGIITNTDLQKMTPNQATTLSVWEINYLLAKTPVTKTMEKNVETVSPNTFLEVAAVQMRSKRISTLAVVEDEKLVGIITESDIFDAFIDILGAREKGTRLTITVVDHPGILAKIAGVLSEYGANISRMVAYNGKDGHTDLVFRFDTTETHHIEEAITRNGFEITDISKTF